MLQFTFLLLGHSLVFYQFFEVASLLKACSYFTCNVCNNCMAGVTKKLLLAVCFNQFVSTTRHFTLHWLHFLGKTSPATEFESYLMRIFLHGTCVFKWTLLSNLIRFISINSLQIANVYDFPNSAAAGKNLRKVEFTSVEYYPNRGVAVKKFALEQAKKVQRGSGGIALLFL